VQRNLWNYAQRRWNGKHLAVLKGCDWRYAPLRSPSLTTATVISLSCDDVTQGGVLMVVLPSSTPKWISSCYKCLKICKINGTLKSNSQYFYGYQDHQEREDNFYLELCRRYISLLRSMLCKPRSDTYPVLQNAVELWCRTNGFCGTNYIEFNKECRGKLGICLKVSVFTDSWLAANWLFRREAA